jgi:hypothetical protein
MYRTNRTEVQLEEARKYNPTAQFGDMVMVDSTPPIWDVLLHKQPGKLYNSASVTLNDRHS